MPPAPDTSAPRAGTGRRAAGFGAGDVGGPDCGGLSIPDRVQQFHDDVEVAVGIGERLGASAFDALLGNRVAGVDPREQDELGRESIALAAEAAGAIGARVLVESVSGPKPYPLRTAAEAVEVVQDVRATGVDNVASLLDLYHLAANGEDLDTAIADDVGVTGRVQVADAPGRGEPGTVELDRRSIPA